MQKKMVKPARIIVVIAGITKEFEDWCKNITLDEMVENNIRFIVGSEGAETEEKARTLK